MTEPVLAMVYMMVIVCEGFVGLDLLNIYIEMMTVYL